MKQLLFKGFLTLALARMAAGQALAGYTNNSPFVGGTAPQIDAINFVNLAPFEFAIGGPTPFDFTDTSFFTNKSTMFCNLGFRFDTETNVSGQFVSQMAASFVNTGINA